MVKPYFELQRPEAPRLHGSETQQPHKSATDKRPRGSPIGETPLDTSKRRPAVSSSRSGVVLGRSPFPLLCGGGEEVAHNQHS